MGPRIGFKALPGPITVPIQGSMAFSGTFEFTDLFLYFNEFNNIPRGTASRFIRDMWHQGGLRAVWP